LRAATPSWPIDHLGVVSLSFRDGKRLLTYFRLRV
jgi:hypothetical protein